MSTTAATTPTPPAAPTPSSVADETRLTADLIGRVRQLSPFAREELRYVLDGEPDGTLEDIRRHNHAEIQRRLEALQRGEMGLLTPEEVVASLRARVARNRGQA